MLFLDRKRNDAIVIADSIRVVVLGVKKSRVVLGIEAPKDMPLKVRRSEPEPKAQTHP